MARKKISKKSKQKVKKAASKKVKAIKRRGKAKAEAKVKAKLLGKIDHYFDKISVAAINVKAPFKVGDYIWIKGHTTDFVQKVESLQIEHESVTKVKKGDDVGLKIKDFVRDHDKVYLADKKMIAALLAKPAQLAAIKPVAWPKKTEEKKAGGSEPFKPGPYQTSIFEPEKTTKSPVAISQPKVVTQPATPAPSQPKPLLKKEEKTDPYSKTRFLSF